MYNKLLNNVRFCLCICAVVALIGLIVGFVLYFKHDTAFAFVVTVGSGLLLFIVVIVATVIFRCLVTRARLPQPHQRRAADYPRLGKVLHDPPPPYKKSWGKEFERSQDTTSRQSSGSCNLSKSGDLIRHLEGCNTTRTSLDKLTQFEVQRQGVPTAGPGLDCPPDDDLPPYDIAIQQLSASDLLNAYQGHAYGRMDEGIVMSSVNLDAKNACSPKESPSTSTQVYSQMNYESRYEHHNVTAEMDFAPAHLPSKTVIAIIACFDNEEDDSVAINIED